MQKEELFCMPNKRRNSLGKRIFLPEFTRKMFSPWNIFTQVVFKSLRLKRKIQILASYTAK